MNKTKEILGKLDSYSFCSDEVEKKTGKECGIFYYADDVEKAMKEYADWKIKECLPLKIHINNDTITSELAEVGHLSNSYSRTLDFVSGYNGCIDQIISNKDNINI